MSQHAVATSTRTLANTPVLPKTAAHLEISGITSSSTHSTPPTHQLWARSMRAASSGDTQQRSATLVTTASSCARTSSSPRIAYALCSACGGKTGPVGDPCPLRRAILVVPSIPDVSGPVYSQAQMSLGLHHHTHTLPVPNSTQNLPRTPRRRRLGPQRRQTRPTTPSRAWTTCCCPPTPCAWRLG